MQEEYLKQAEILWTMMKILDFLLQIGKCRYIMCGTFETGRQGLDASLESGLGVHRDLVASAHPNGGVGADPFITIGKIGRAPDGLGDDLSLDCANTFPTL